jgi:hypothetical protein
VSLCLASAGAIKAIALTAFTLVWTHSIEKVDWQEDWLTTPAGLELVQARVKGSGAGMEPPPEARLVNGWFQWTPKRPPMPEVALGNSGAAGEWRLCRDGDCQTLSDILGHPVGVNVTTMKACAPYGGPEFADALNASGEDWRGKGDNRRALRDFAAALKVDPNNAAAFANHKALALQLEREGAQMGLKRRP